MTDTGRHFDGREMLMLHDIGMLMYEGDPEVVDAAIATMPESVRPVIREMAAQAFAEHSLRVHGTATPPRGGVL